MIFHAFELSLDFLERCHDFEIVMRCPCDIFFMRFPYEMLCLLQWNFRIRFLSAAQFSCKISLVDVTLFETVMRFLYEMYAF
jgi:hypothetical protein